MFGPGAAETDLRGRLRAALHQPGRPGGAVRAESVTELQDLSVLGGRWFESADGPGYMVESVYEAGHAHGDIPLHRALSLDVARLGGQVRDARLADCSCADLLYIDTETTGLGGAGAMVFLAGVARFDGSLLKLRQYVLPGPQYEGGLLGGLAAEIDGATALVSYNGKSFDLPMLETRYILSRKRPNLRQLPHLDLLHPNRRLFRGAMDSYRLTQVELELLGFQRDDDCPSAEVPERYFRFQRSGDPTHILPVLRHNAWDILSLVALAAHLAAVVTTPDYPLQQARAAEYEGDHALAAAAYERALAAGIGRAERPLAMERAARCWRKAGNLERAAHWWRSLIAEPRARRLLPYVELAKILEHHSHDRAAALEVVETAIRLVAQGLVRPGPAGGETSLDALSRRRARLSPQARPA